MSSQTDQAPQPRSSLANLSPTEQMTLAPSGSTQDLCDLCQTSASVVVREDPQENGHILLCRNCLLMYRCPQMAPKDLDAFYEDIFENDPGCRMRAGDYFAPDKDRKKEEVLAENWGLKIIKRFMDPRGKRILDVRCRTGALTSHLINEGAEVLGTEPFQANAEYARQVRNLPNIIDLPFSKFAQFPFTEGTPFDAINVLGHHVLAHVLSPRILLKRLYEVLKPGGFLFLDEKDVLLPVRHKKQSALDSGPAHQFHLTLHTTGRYIQMSGFELLECEIDKYRVSDFRHIRIVARKPGKDQTATAPSQQQQFSRVQSVEGIKRRLWWLERTWRIRLTQAQYKRKFQRKLQKWGW